MSKTLRKVYLYWENFGTKKLLLKVIEKTFSYKKKLERRVKSPESKDMHIAHAVATTHILQQRFPNIKPLPICSNFDNTPRINLVTDSLLDDSFYGGIATSIIFAILIANNQKKKLRIITRHTGGGKANFKALIDRENLILKQNVEFILCPLAGGKYIDTCDEDVFITTSWWTTASVQKSIPDNQVIYILQEDERMFYPFGDEHLLCSEVMASPNINILVNTKLLYTHLIKEGFENISAKGLYFEPSFNKILYKRNKAKVVKNKRRLFFYARPGHARNLFYRGIEALDKALELGVIDTNLWDLYFLGTASQKIKFSNGYSPISLPNLPWNDYIDFLQTVDLGLSLMYTPHPSYPPFDLATTGCVVITNKFGIKENLTNYSKNILTSDLDIRSLVETLENGILLSTDNEKRYENYLNNNIESDWSCSFNYAIKKFTN